MRGAPWRLARPFGGQSPDDTLFDLGELADAEAIMVSLFNPIPRWRRSCARSG